MAANYIPLVASLVQAFVNIFVRRKAVRDLVLPLIEQAAKDGTLPDSAARRNFVLGILTSTAGLSESESRLLIEAGLKLYKRREEKRREKEERAERRAARKREREG